MNVDRCSYASDLIGMLRLSFDKSIFTGQYLPAQIWTLAAACTLTPQTARNQRDVLNDPNQDAAVLPLSPESTPLFKEEVMNISPRGESFNSLLIFKPIRRRRERSYLNYKEAGVWHNLCIRVTLTEKWCARPAVPAVLAQC